MRIVIGPVFVLLIATLVSACGGDDTSEAREAEMEEYARSYGVDVDVEIDESTGEESVVINQGIGAMAGQVGTNLRVPAGFPDDIVLFPGMKIHSSSGIPQGHTLQGTVEGSSEDVAEFYREGMAKKGWQTEGPGMQSPAMHSLQFKKDNRQTNISVMPNGERSTVQIMTMKTG